jgi:deoxyribodipyrimidine photo-lyase
MNKASLLWLRLDLRLADNPALAAAVARARPVVPVFVWSPDEEGRFAPGAASRWWLHQSLSRLDHRLREAGSRLIIRLGPSIEALLSLARESGANAVFWNRRYEPAAIERDKLVEAALQAAGLEARSFNAALLHEPSSIRNRSGKPFQVFTPFWRHCLSLSAPARPSPAPGRLLGPAKWPASLALGDLGLEPKVNWTEGLRASWNPGEAGALASLKRFLATAFDDYPADRDRPALAGTSRLSPHLHFGEIGPRQVWDAVRKLAARRGLPAADWRGSRFLAELGWREFAHHLLFHFPGTPCEPLRAEFKRFPWRQNPKLLCAWQTGRTGFPIVDAGMRELWATGWMHNRVRMLVASFLVKDLLLSWREGAAWFWDTLVDADLAQNTLGWQWTAGCGADAAPYFRIFNPALQGARFDPQGDYVRRWCPELAKLPARWIHQPHLAPAAVLSAANVALGHAYPRPVVNHAQARLAALKAFASVRNHARRSPINASA